MAEVSTPDTLCKLRGSDCFLQPVLSLRFLAIHTRALSRASEEPRLVLLLIQLKSVGLASNSDIVS